MLFDSELDPVGQQPDYQGSRLELFETTHDFGKVFRGRELTHTSIIKNTGDAPLHITGFGVGA